MHKLVFENGGLPDGTEVAYYSNGKVVDIECIISLFSYFSVVIFSLSVSRNCAMAIKWDRE